MILQCGTGTVKSKNDLLLYRKVIDKQPRQLPRVYTRVIRHGTTTYITPIDTDFFIQWTSLHPFQLSLEA